MNLVGYRIREARKAAGWSQQRLAEELGISVQAVSQWETHKTTPDWTRIKSSAAALKVSESWLIGAEHGEIQRRPAGTEAFGGDPVRVVPFKNVVSWTYFPDQTVQVEDKNPTWIIPTLSRTGAIIAVRLDEKYDYREEFSSGDILIFDTGVPAEVDDTVLGIVFVDGAAHAAIDRVRSVSAQAKPVHGAESAGGYAMTAMVTLHEHGEQAAVLGTLVESRQIWN